MNISFNHKMASLTSSNRASHPPGTCNTGILPVDMNVSFNHEMASLTSCNRARRLPSTCNTGILPVDMLFDVLLWLPAKDLCRFRAVCRSWRSLTCDPLFIRAHAERHPDPLFLARFNNDRTLIHVMDLSGNVIKRIPNLSSHNMLFGITQDLVCVASFRNICRVLNPVTGAVYVLPETPTEITAGHLDPEKLRNMYTCFAFGRIANTGVYKVLRTFNVPNIVGFKQQQLFEVFTINGGAGHAQWRQKKSHEHFVDTYGSTVVNGMVYFFKIDGVVASNLWPIVHPDCIFSFNLVTEEWRRDLKGPISGSLLIDNYEEFEDYCSVPSHFKLSGLRGSLVLVHYRAYRSIMDLWLLKDFENDLWMKEFHIQTTSIIPPESLGEPLFVLDDGRIVIEFSCAGIVLIYDPRTNTSAEVQMMHLDAVSMYTGSLLSLQVGDMV